MNQMNKLKLLSILLIFTSCGFSSSLYNDILDAQDLIAKQEFEDAAEIYESILERKPSKNIKIKINFQLGEIYSIYLEDYKKSLVHFNKIVSDSNEPLWQVKSLEKIAAIHYDNLQNYKLSKSYYFELMNFVPKLEKQSFYKFRYALSIFHLNEYSNAIKIFKDLSQEEENDEAIQSYYYLGLSYYYKEDWAKANKNWFEYLKREKRKDRIVKTKFLIANAYESSEKLKEAYNIYYSILGEYPNPEVIRSRLNSLYERRVARKR